MSNILVLLVVFMVIGCGTTPSVAPDVDAGFDMPDSMVDSGVSDIEDSQIPLEDAFVPVDAPMFVDAGEMADSAVLVEDAKVLFPDSGVLDGGLTGPEICREYLAMFPCGNPDCDRAEMALARRPACSDLAIAYYSCFVEMANESGLTCESDAVFLSALEACHDEYLTFWTCDL